MLLCPGGGRLQSRKKCSSFPAQLARRCLIRFAQSQLKLRQLPLIPLLAINTCASLGFKTVRCAHVLLSPGGGRLQSRKGRSSFPDQLARRCLIRYAQSQLKLRQLPLIPLLAINTCASLSIQKSICIIN